MTRVGQRFRYERALEAIRDRCGAVCPEYEACTHPWCASSYTAWALADEALRSEAAGSQTKPDRAESLDQNEGSGGSP